MVEIGADVGIASAGVFSITSLYLMPAPTGDTTLDEAALSAALAAMPNGGTISFQNGTYAFNLNHAVGDSGDTSIPGDIKGYTFRGQSTGATVLSFAPSTPLFLFTVGDGVNSFQFVKFQDMSISLANTTALGAINLKDPCRFCTMDNLQIIGQDSTHGTGILLSGKVSANSFHNIHLCAFRKMLTGVQLSGFANSNYIEDCWFGTVTTGLLYDKTVVGDTQGGQTNTASRCEFNGSTTTGITLASNATGNTFLSCICDGPTTSVSISASSTGNTFVGCSLPVRSISTTSRTIILGQDAATTGIQLLLGNNSTLGVLPTWQSGKVYGPVGNVSANQSRVMANASNWYLPFYVPNTVTINKIGVEITNAGTTAVIRLGIYTDNGSNTAPATLVTNSDAGALSVSGTGVLESTLTSVTLTAGMYWVAVNQPTSAANATLRALGANVSNPFIGGASGTDITQGNTGALKTANGAGDAAGFSSTAIAPTSTASTAPLPYLVIT